MKFPLIVLTLLSSLLASCSTSHAPLETVQGFRATEYAGVWHEIARLPNPFERNVVAARATYGELDGGKLSVLNEGLKTNGEDTSIAGTATPAGEGKYKIRFDRFPANLFAGDYWVLWVDRGYEMAVVGTPDRKFLWLLAKDRRVVKEDFAGVLEEMKQKGFATEQIYENPKRLF